MTTSDASAEYPQESLPPESETSAKDLNIMFTVMYEELHRLATAYMQGERPDHTLQPTALIHEVWTRLRNEESEPAKFADAVHFMATAATTMRRILINHAKARRAQKRGAGAPRLSIDLASLRFEEKGGDLVELDQALLRLAEVSPHQARLVEMRYFGGMTIEQCAAILNVSPRTLYYDWALARAWLRRELEAQQSQ